MGRHTLKITVQEEEEAVAITLEGRVAGPWVAELSRTWHETTPRLKNRKLILDLRNVTYSDAPGKRVLRDICAQTSPKLLTDNLGTRYLAEEITTGNRPNE